MDSISSQVEKLAIQDETNEDGRKYVYVFIKFKLGARRIHGPTCIYNNRAKTEKPGVVIKEPGLATEAGVLTEEEEPCKQAGRASCNCC